MRAMNSVWCALVCALGTMVGSVAAEAAWTTPASATQILADISPTNISNSWYSSNASADDVNGGTNKVTPAVESVTGITVVNDTQVFSFGGPGSGPLTGTFNAPAGTA